MDPHLKKALTSHLALWQSHLVRQMKTVEMEEVWDREVQRRIARSKTTRERATTRLSHAMSRRAEAKALLAEASKEYRAHLKKQAEIKMKQEQEQQAALEHGIVVEEQGPPDITRDIRWVYDNYAKLFVVTDLGTRVFDTEVLETAPSQGAVTMAEYALRKPDGFVERFVIRLLPKGAGEPDETTAQTDEDRMAAMDPAFADMADFFKQDPTE